MTGRLRLELPGTQLTLSAVQMTLLAVHLACAGVVEPDSSLLLILVMRD